jgi:hypothetical protein
LSDKHLSVTTAWLNRGIAVVAGLTVAIFTAGAATASADDSVLAVLTTPNDSRTAGSYQSATFPYFPDVAITIVHNGAVAATQSGSGFAEVPVLPAVGDTVQLEKPPGVVIESLLYDGRPTIDPSTCIGSRSISGQRSDAGMTVEASAYSESGYGNYQDAQITSLSGTSYAGTFPHPLAGGDQLFVQQYEVYPRSYGSFDYASGIQQAVPACPPPPVVPVAKPTSKAPRASIALNGKRALRAFFRKGLIVTVTVDQAGRIVEDMFLAKGKLPAKATKRKSKPAKLIGRGTATATKAGKVKVRVRPTKGAKRLRKKRKLSVAFLTTVTNLGKQSTTLPPKRLKLTR